MSNTLAEAIAKAIEDFGRNGMAGQVVEPIPTLSADALAFRAVTGYSPAGASARGHECPRCGRILQTAKGVEDHYVPSVIEHGKSLADKRPMLVVGRSDDGKNLYLKCTADAFATAGITPLSER